MQKVIRYDLMCAIHLTQDYDWALVMGSTLTESVVGHCDNTNPNYVEAYTRLTQQLR